MRPHLTVSNRYKPFSNTVNRFLLSFFCQVLAWDELMRADTAERSVDVRQDRHLIRKNVQKKNTLETSSEWHAVERWPQARAMVSCLIKFLISTHYMTKEYLMGTFRQWDNRCLGLRLTDQRWLHEMWVSVSSPLKLIRTSWHPGADKFITWRFVVLLDVGGVWWTPRYCAVRPC